MSLFKRVRMSTSPFNVLYYHLKVTKMMYDETDNTLFLLIHLKEK